MILIWKSIKVHGVIGKILRFAPEHMIFLFTIKVYLDSVLSAVSGYRKLPNSAKDFICRSA